MKKYLKFENKEDFRKYLNVLKESGYTLLSNGDVVEDFRIGEAWKAYGKRLVIEIDTENKILLGCLIDSDYIDKGIEESTIETYDSTNK